MDFAELLKDLLSNEIFNSIWGLIGPTVATVVGILWGKTKKKLTTLATSSDSNLSTILGELKNAVNKLNDVEARCAQLAEENQKKDEELAKLTNSITNVGNMVSIGFLDTKGISADAKVKISESVAFLANNGLDISKTQQAIDSITQKANEKVEAIFQAREIVDTNAKESEEKAAATETEAISIMNKIVETHEQ